MTFSVLKDRRPRSVAGSRSCRRSVGRGAEVHPSPRSRVASQSAPRLHQSGDPGTGSQGTSGLQALFQVTDSRGEMTLPPSRASCDLAIGDTYAAARAPRMPLSLRGDFFSVNCGREQSVPAEGYAILRGSWGCALSAAYGLHGSPRSMSSARALRTCAINRRRS
jgi:hypothetical protein